MDRPLSNPGKRPRKAAGSISSLSDLMQRILPEDLFLGMLCLERMRAERSRKPMLLLLLDAKGVRDGRRAQVLANVVTAANAARRETDPAGWYEQDSILGVIFTEVRGDDQQETIEKLCAKVRAALLEHLSSEDLHKLQISAHVFGGDSNGDDLNIPSDPTFYPDLTHLQSSKKIPFILKRVIDIVGSTLAILVFSPVLLLIAAAVKFTSKGPALFKQERLGQFGKTFTCLKFRTMSANNDLKIHQEFAKRLSRWHIRGG